MTFIKNDTNISLDKSSTIDASDKKTNSVSIIDE